MRYIIGLAALSALAGAAGAFLAYHAILHTPVEAHDHDAFSACVYTHNADADAHQIRKRNGEWLRIDGGDFYAYRDAYAAYCDIDAARYAYEDGSDHHGWWVSPTGAQRLWDLGL